MMAKHGTRRQLMLGAMLVGCVLWVAWSMADTIMGLLRLDQRHLWNASSQSFSPSIEHPILPDEVKYRQDISAIRDYLHSWNNSFSRQSSLLFVHIPKTGGTTMETSVAARQANLSWGKCMMRADPPPVCPEQPTIRLNFTVPRPSPWHWPVFLFPLQGMQPYEGSDLMAVVRHPLERLQSDYHYWCHIGQIQSNVTSLKQFVQSRLRRSKPWLVPRNMSTSLHHQNNYTGLWAPPWEDTTWTVVESVRLYTLDDGHFSPQIDFVIGPHQVRYVDHVLRMDEHLAADFGSLASAYHLPLQWPAQKDNVGTYQRSVDWAAVLGQDLWQELNETLAPDWIFFSGSYRSRSLQPLQ